VREETQREPICVYCKQPITQKQWPYRTLASGEKAHLACYLDHAEDDEQKPVP
jgi:hypothetical protein